MFLNMPCDLLVIVTTCNLYVYLDKTINSFLINFNNTYVQAINNKVDFWYLCLSKMCALNESFIAFTL